MAERILFATLVGGAMATLVWVFSTAVRAPHVWPGTILCFCSTTATWLLFLRVHGRGGR